MRYYDQETYVLYRKFYEDTNIIEFEDVMSPISKKKLNVENIITSVNCIERFTSQVAHITKFWKNILTQREVFTVKIFNSQKANELDFIQIFKINVS